MNAMNKKRGLAGMVAVLFLGLAVLLLSACSDEMEVQQSYPVQGGEHACSHTYNKRRDGGNTL